MLACRLKGIASAIPRTTRKRKDAWRVRQPAVRCPIWHSQVTENAQTSNANLTPCTRSLDTGCNWTPSCTIPDFELDARMTSVTPASVRTSSFLPTPKRTERCMHAEIPKCHATLLFLHVWRFLAVTQNLLGCNVVIMRVHATFCQLDDRYSHTKNAAKSAMLPL